MTTSFTVVSGGAGVCDRQRRAQGLHIVTGRVVNSRPADASEVVRAVSAVHC